MEEYEKEHVVKLCVDGLTTDGGHHKQWHLEKILLFISGKPAWDELKRKHGWDKGIAP